VKTDLKEGWEEAIEAGERDIVGQQRRGKVVIGEER